jgi:hypothetical protein
MPSVVIHRPGTSRPEVYHNPDTGEDQAMTEWSFTATVDGQTGVVSAVFPKGTTENGAANVLHAQLQANPSTLGGIASTGAGGGAAGAGASGPAGSGATSGGATGGGTKNPNCIPKMKTYE